MRGARITVRCDCGEITYLDYGEVWTCPSCGRQWNTGQIPEDEYWDIMRRMRQYRIQVMGVALAVALGFVALGMLMGSQVWLLAPVVITFWLLVFMPRWRRKVRAAARSLPTWKLRPEERP
jgi:hypothetical protein